MIASNAMAIRAPLEHLVQELKLRWLNQPGWDTSEVYVEAKGEVASLPEPATVERVFVAMGFTCRTVVDRPSAKRLSGRRGEETVTCILLPELIRNGRRIRGSEVTLEWRSGERPRLVGGEADWHGRRWPAFFEEPCLYFESATLLIVEGRIPASGISECLARYKMWAEQSGLTPHREYEPDLNGDAGFAERDFVVTVQDRHPYITLTVRRREEGEVA
jgi:hypothetical protein